MIYANASNTTGFLCLSNKFFLVCLRFKKSNLNSLFRKTYCQKWNFQWAKLRPEVNGGHLSGGLVSAFPRNINSGELSGGEVPCGGASSGLKSPMGKSPVGKSLVGNSPLFNNGGKLSGGEVEYTFCQIDKSCHSS